MELDNKPFQKPELKSSYESIKAVVTLQKVYRSYRTRSRLADSAIVAEELWWQAIEYARLNHTTTAFFNLCQPEKATSRWSRVSWNASKVGKGLEKDAKARKLTFQHWIEAIDPRHRYGHNLNVYFDEWYKGETGHPFFYWLDIGEGKELDLEECSKSRLRQECIIYLGPQERMLYEYVIADGKVIHKRTGDFLDTHHEVTGSKWIFVMSTSQKLYAGKKMKGMFHHSSFLAGGATLAAGRLEAERGKLKSVSPHSGHYRPTEENLSTFLAFLRNNGVCLEEVQAGNFLRTTSLSYDEFDSMAGGCDSGVQSESEKARLQVTYTTELKQSSKQCLLSDNKAQYSFKKNLPIDPGQRMRFPDSETRIDTRMDAKLHDFGPHIPFKMKTGAGSRLGHISENLLQREHVMDFHVPEQEIPGSAALEFYSQRRNPHGVIRSKRNAL